ncbi:MAG: histidinol-phosphatase HisJ family protein [Rikenellaceae bacterium]
MKLTDSHTHSEFSPDSRMTMEQAVKRAIASGLSGLIITDHLDIKAPKDGDNFKFDPEVQQKRIESLNSMYDIEILKGIEVGLQLHTMDEVTAFVGKYKFDQIIASVHFIDGIDPYYRAYYVGKDADTAYGRYLETIYLCISQFRNFDILGHYDYITRYAPYEEKAILYSRFGEILDQILIILAKEGKALEINTNTYREKNSAIPFLDTDVLKRFKELGGEAVSLGSDAHDQERIGEKFAYYTEIIKSCGFRHIAHFKNREVQFISI